jgi:hypothetical protein
MAILLADTFDRIAGTLGADWTEWADPECPGAGHCGGVLPSVCSNLSTDGSLAQIDSTAFHIATANGTNLTNQYVQAWCRTKAGNNAGIVFRFKDTCNFLFALLDVTTGNVQLRKRVAGVITLIAQTAGGVVTGSWQRLAVVATDIGGGSTRIEIYLDQTYNSSTNEGPQIVFTNSDAALQGAGRVGIITTGNNATGGSGPQWNDFIARDGQPETVYVDKDYNSGLPGAGMGTIDRPDLDIDWALNNAGCVRGSKIKLTDALYTNGATTRFRIGHGRKFESLGYSFPVYSDDSGEVTNPGNPNLIIEGADGAIRTECQEDTGLAYFFNIRGFARGIVFRGIDFTSDDLTRSVRTQNAGQPDYGFSIDKCTFTLRTGGTPPVLIDGTCVLFRMTYCFAKQLVVIDHNADVFFTLGRVVYGLVRMNVFDAAVDFCVNISQSIPDMQPGDVLDIDHNTYYGRDDFARTTALLAVLDPIDVDTGARVTGQNNVAYIVESAAPLSTGYGFYQTPTTPPNGLLELHHNGYGTTPGMTACYGAPGHNWTIGDAETCTGNPGFVNPAVSFLWQHTSGKGLNGEGTFGAITIDRDLRVTETGFKDAADDSTPLQVLDKGALQDFFPAGTQVPSVGSPTPTVELGPAFCPSVIYDPLGPNETDLSGKLVDMRPLSQERDALLRSYRASDLDIDFMDTDGLFLETNPATFLLGADGRPNWLGKPVVVAGLLGSTLLARYRGFVVGVEAERGIGRLRIANRLQYMFDRAVRANGVGRIVSTTGAAGIGPATATQPNAPVTGFWLGNLTLRGQTPFDAATAPIVQTWTVTFTTAGPLPNFYVTGSETGFDGEGKYGTPFSYVSKSGTIAINTAVAGDFDGFGAGTITKDQTCSIQTVWRATAGVRSVAALRVFLLDPRGGGLWPGGLGLVGADIDPSFDVFLGTLSDQVIDNVPATVNTQSRMVIDKEATVLEAIDLIARHSGVIVVELEDARLGLVSLLPRQLTEAPDIICKSEDLLAAVVGHLPIYNDFAFEYDYDERIAKFQEAEHYPTPAIANDSLARYGRLYPAPSTFQYKAFSGSNQDWIRTIMTALYARYRDPRRLYQLRAGFDRLNAELDDVYSVDSEAPTFRAAAVEPVKIDRMLTGGLETQIEAMDVSDTTTFPGGCGYAYHDQHPHDSCWKHF